MESQLVSHRDPTSYQWIEYVGVVALAMWGGAVNYWRKLQSGGKLTAFSLLELAWELATSGFVGLLVFWLCETQDLDGRLTAVFVGIAGHMAGRTIMLLQRWAMKLWRE